MSCTHCEQVVATYVWNPPGWTGYDVVAMEGGHPASFVAKWPASELLKCDCRCHDIWKTWRPR